MVDPGEEQEIIAYFWLSNQQLKYLSEGYNEKEEKNQLTWFRICTEDHNKVFLEAIVHEQADLKKDYLKLIKNLEKKDSNLASQFNKLISKSQPIFNGKSHNYITLIADTNKGNQVERRLDWDFMKLSKFSDEAIQKRCPFNLEKGRK